MFTTISTVFALGNSSDAFLFLDGGPRKLSRAVPLIYFRYNLVYAALATPLGALSDKWGRLPVLMSGYIAFGLVYAGWAFANAGLERLAAVPDIWRLLRRDRRRRQGVRDGHDAEEARGTAMGWFNGLIGFAALPANLIGGWLWSVAGPSATFIFGAWTAAVAIALTIAWLPGFASPKPKSSLLLLLPSLHLPKQAQLLRSHRTYLNSTS